MMKALSIILSIALILSNSYKKQRSNGTATVSATVPLLYQVFDKKGNNIFAPHINSKDSVMLTGSNGVFYDQIQEPGNALANALLMKKYGGVMISDNRIVRYNNPGGLAANQQNTFTISYHGKNLGVIIFKLKQQHPLWAEAAVFTLNNIPAKLDSATGIHIYKLLLPQ